MWKDSCLPEETYTTPKRHGKMTNPDLFVNDLYILGTEIWSEQLIRNLVNEERCRQNIMHSS